MTTPADTPGTTPVTTPPAPAAATRTAAPAKKTAPAKKAPAKKTPAKKAASTQPAAAAAAHEPLDTTGQDDLTHVVQIFNTGVLELAEQLHLTHAQALRVAADALTAAADEHDQLSGTSSHLHSTAQQPTGILGAAPQQTTPDQPGNTTAAHTPTGLGWPSRTR